MAREGGAQGAAARNTTRPASKSMQPLKGLWPYLKPYKWLVAGACVALFCASALTLTLPIALRRVIDLGFDAQKSAYVDKYFIALILVAGLLALATAARFYLVSRLGERAMADLRKDVYNHLIGMSPAFFEEIKTGEALSRLTTDTSVIQSVIGSSISIALRNILLLIGGMTLLFFTSAKLSLLVLLVVPFVIIPIIFLGRKVRALSRLSQDKIADASGMASETLSAASVIQAFSNESIVQAQFGNRAEEAYQAARDRIRVRSFLTAIIIFLVFSSIVGVMWMGARDVILGRMTGGELGQFILYAVFVAGAVGALAEIWGEIQRAAGAAERLLEILATKNPITTPNDPISLLLPVKGKIEFNNIEFEYPSRPNEPTLKNFSLTINPGETVALVGPSGGGKTTVLQLLLRYYDLKEGSIALDGQKINLLNPSDLREKIAFVPQDSVIFADTAAANIGFGDTTATFESIENAAKMAAAHDFISDLPDGYQSDLGERGIKLSGGQKQRIAIARAVLKDAPILLLDEATSALDAESEQAVQKAFAEMSKDTTTLVIAHRLATVKQADRIIVIEDGRITAQGTHAELMQESALYQRLARLQFADFTSET